MSVILVFLVVVPRELAVEPGKPHDRVVGSGEVCRLPRLSERGDTLRNRRLYDDG